MYFMIIAINMLRLKSILFHLVEIQIRINTIKNFLKNSAIASSSNRTSNISNIVNEDLR